MTMDEILEQTVKLAENDQSIADTDVISWVNMAINRINTACQCKIPLVSDVGQTEPAFDSRFHEALVLFGVAKYRESDSSYNDAAYFMNEFKEMVKIMQRDMVITPSIRLHPDYQQIIVDDANVTTYALTMPYGSYFDIVEVYLNDKLVDARNYSIKLESGTILFTKVTLTKGDRITVHFENNSDLNAPPYKWWGW